MFLKKNKNNFIPIPHFFQKSERLKIFKKKDLFIDIKESFFLKKKLISSVLKYDFQNYLRDDILVKIDRASMQNSVEARSPFLDRKIVEYAFNKLNKKHRVSFFSTKIILKQLGKQILPKNFNFERKQGFSFPLKHYLNNKSWQKRIKEILMDRNCIFDEDYISQLFRYNETGDYASEKLFSLIFFENWRNKYKIVI